MDWSKSWNRVKRWTECISCGVNFHPTNNRIKECYICVPKEFRAFNNKTRKVYGIGYVEFISSLKAQGNKCKICSVNIIPNSTGNNKNSAVIDHCHSTGYELAKAAYKFALDEAVKVVENNAGYSSGNAAKLFIAEAIKGLKE